MASKEFPLVPETVEQIETANRKIVTQIPVPESVALLEKLRSLEPRSMGGQPPIVWDHGDGAHVFDPYGNKWLDFSSGVLVTASGHGRKEIIDAIKGVADQGLYHAYAFPTDVRVKLVEKLTSLLPAPLARVFLLTTGSEATECCIKLARTQGKSIADNKDILVTFENGFHGRTMGAQMAGGSPGLKSWIGEIDDRFVQVPFPDGFRQEDISFDVFVNTLAAKGVDPSRVCGVMGETYQGCNATVMPSEYAQKLRKWCDDNDALMIFDEVQAGFGRTGTPFGFTDLGVVPDLVACGKGISGGMPLSAVFGTEKLMSIYGPGEMTSTHSANPICSAAALANLEIMEKEQLIANAAKLAPILAEAMEKMQEVSGGKIGRVASIGLVSAAQFTKPGTTEPDPEPAWEVVRQAVQQGLMVFAPVGVGGCALKISPPLVISEAQLKEGLDVLIKIVESL